MNNVPNEALKEIKSRCHLRDQELREALKISRPLALVLGKAPRFHGRSVWHSALIL